MLFASSLIGQHHYEFELFITDATGLKDTVRYIFTDSLRMNENRARFGYKNITDTTWDTQFEVRGSAFCGTEMQSKVYVDFYLPWFCPDGFAKYAGLVIRAKSFPVTISWDSTYFNDNCLWMSRVTRSVLFTQNPVTYPDEYWLLRDRSNLVITEEFLEESREFKNEILQNIEDGTQDSVFVLFVGVASKLVGSSSTRSQTSIHLVVSPNPTSDFLIIDGIFDDIKFVTYDIYDLDGALIQSGYVGPTDKVDLKELKEGAYVLTASHANSFYSCKFVVKR